MQVAAWILDVGDARRSGRSERRGRCRGRGQRYRMKRRTSIVLGLAAALAGACGGRATSDGSGADAGDADVVDGSAVCPTPPDAAVYACEVGPPDSAGCRAAELDPNADADPNVYPEGCIVTLPRASTYCGPIGCTCMTLPSPVDAGLQFICPL